MSRCGCVMDDERGELYRCADHEAEAAHAHLNECAHCGVPRDCACDECVHPGGDALCKACCRQTRQEPAA